MSILHYEADKYFLDMTGTIFQNPVWKNYMSVGFTNYTDEEANYMALEGEGPARRPSGPSGCTSAA